MAKERDPGKEWLLEDGAPTIRPDGAFRLTREDIELYKQAMERRKGSLVVIDGPPADIGNTVVVEDLAIIGREQSDLVLRDGMVSRRHALVERRENGYVLRDNHSTNGTRLNGNEVQGELPIVEGDRIIIGGTIIKFTMVDDTEADYLSTMDKLVGTDNLTGLMAKHRFDSSLGEAIRTALHLGHPLSVLMMDIDHLKAINDTHGHHAGEGTIRKTGWILSQLLEGRGVACRFGGDEFCAFLPGADISAALEIGEQIRRAVEEKDFGEGDQALHTSISIGAAQLPPELNERMPLVDLADQALYRSKAAGRNNVSD